MTNQFELVIPTLLGLESFTAREVKRLGYTDIKTEDGRITFRGDAAAICRANIGIRTGERVLLKIGEFHAETFEELFQQTKALPWSHFIPREGAFPVKGHSLKSTLASVRDCQAIIKKAVAVSLGETYGCTQLPEDGALYQIQFSIHKNKVLLMIDTSGQPLHKRGYRIQSNLAPLRETIAAAMVMVSYWKFEYPLIDPFCGSGTIPIEAAMIKKNISPGMHRSFSAEQFPWLPEKLWKLARDEAASLIRHIPLDITGIDIDQKTVEIARQNAVRAGLDGVIRFHAGDARHITSDRAYGAVICNPPYGERLGEKKDCEALYRQIGKAFSALPDWSYYILTSNEAFEGLFGRRADKKRKIYNGMIKCNLYQYFGPKPPKMVKTDL